MTLHLYGRLPADDAKGSDIYFTAPLDATLRTTLKALGKLVTQAEDTLPDRFTGRINPGAWRGGEVRHPWLFENLTQAEASRAFGQALYLDVRQSGILFSAAEMPRARRAHIGLPNIYSIFCARSEGIYLEAWIEGTAGDHRTPRVSEYLTWAAVAQACRET